MKRSEISNICRDQCCHLGNTTETCDTVTELLSYQLPHRISQGHTHNRSIRNFQWQKQQREVITDFKCPTRKSAAIWLIQRASNRAPLIQKFVQKFSDPDSGTFILGALHQQNLNVLSLHLLSLYPSSKSVHKLPRYYAKCHFMLYILMVKNPGNDPEYTRQSRLLPKSNRYLL